MGVKKIFPCVFLIVFSMLFEGCRDRVFDNPFDPNAEDVFFEVTNTILTPASYPQGLAWDGAMLWNVDGAYGIAYSLDRLSGVQIRALTSPLPGTSGIAYDGQELWVCSETSSLVYRLNILNGDIQKVLDLQKGFFSAVEYALDSLWLADMLTNSVIQVNPETGEILTSFENPGFRVDGLAFDGTHFWISDSSTLTIYRMTSAGDVIQSYLAPGQAPRGLTFDGYYLWNVDGGLKLYQLKFED